MSRKLICFFLLVSFPLSILAKGKPKQSLSLLSQYKINYKKKSEVELLKKNTLALAGKALPSLVKVMKSSKYPDKNRWVATFLLGRIAGKKSSSFLAKFLKHPNWVMRMASLKTLLALKEKKFAKNYARALNDNSLIVRTQALENIRRLNLQGQSQFVWAMLYDKRNYYSATDKFKRSSIIKKIIKTVGDLKFEKAEAPLLKMAQKKKYDDIFDEIDYGLERITGKKSPTGRKLIKKRYWKRLAMSKVTI
jgi:hypothetical protein